MSFFFFFQAEDGIRDIGVTGVQTCALPISDGLPRVLRIDGFAMDMVPEGHMVVLTNKDQPGVIGAVGTLFGEAQVNIADMVISREVQPDGTAHAIMLI